MSTTATATSTRLAIETYRTLLNHLATQPATANNRAALEHAHAAFTAATAHLRD